MKELCCKSAEELFLLQKKEWAMLRMGYEALSEVEERKVRVMNAEFKIQYNPARLRKRPFSDNIQAISDSPSNSELP